MELLASFCLCFLKKTVRQDGVHGAVTEVEDDCAFVLSRYFHGEAFERKAITKHEHYSQRGQIAELFGY
ncbi:hypothetical protein, partial [Pseudomonas putida]|uniref:hypothetical protein n=1 Tax=Pseudomonas putida TaxID=303 RepID=UPI00125D91A5